MSDFEHNEHASTSAINELLARNLAAIKAQRDAKAPSPAAPVEAPAKPPRKSRRSKWWREAASRRERVTALSSGETGSAF